MDRVHRDKRKEVHARLDFGEGSKEKRTREDSHHSSARTLIARPERLKVRDRLRYGDRHVLDRLGHRRQSVFDRLSETYSPSTTKSRPGRTNSRDHPRGRNRPRRLDASNEGCHEDREHFRGVGESYDDSSSHSYHDRDHSHHMKRRRDNESPLSNVSKSDSSDGRMPNNVKMYDETGDPEDHVKIFHAAAQVKRWAMPTWCHMFNSTLIGAVRVWFDEIPLESVDSYKDLKAVFLAYFMQQKKYVKDPVEIHNIKQKDRDTIEDFMERFKVETVRMKRSPECKLSHLHKEIKHGRDQSKVGKKETPAKDKPAAIYMIQSWQRMTRQKVAQSFKRIKEITFPPLTTSSGAERPLVIEAEFGGHMIYRMYVDGGSSMEILYEHCFNRLWPEVRNQMVLATTSLTGFSGETIWLLRQLRLLVTIGDADHSTRACMNFMIVRSLSPYNGIIGRPRIKEIQAVPSTAHVMLKFPVDGGIVTIRSTVLIPAECATVITSSTVPKEGYSPVRQKKRGQAQNALRPYKQRIVIPFLKSIGKSNLSVATLSSVLWTLTKAITRYSWQSQTNRKRLSTPAKGCIVIQMPFGLKNGGATYQRLVDKAFYSQIGRNIEVYVDDLVVKSHTEAEMLRDIGETFRTLQKSNMKLNPKKYFLAEVPDESSPAASVVGTQQVQWTLFMDGSSSYNNEAEYEALIAGLRITAQIGVQNVHVSVDFKLVANQVLGRRQESFASRPDSTNDWRGFSTDGNSLHRGYGALNHSKQSM
nr:reverse transcriptase domain-containing protein [Tanacetum cinerariifolium]